MVLCQDDDTLLFGSKKNTIALWSIDKKREIITINYLLKIFNDAVSSVAINESKKCIISSERGRIKIWH